GLRKAHSPPSSQSPFDVRLTYLLESCHDTSAQKRVEERRRRVDDLLGRISRTQESSGAEGIAALGSGRCQPQQGFEGACLLTDRLEQAQRVTETRLRASYVPLDQSQDCLL